MSKINPYSATEKVAILDEFETGELCISVHTLVRHRYELYRDEVFEIKTAESGKGGDA